MPLTIPMKFTLCLSLLLTGLQVHCHHVPGHHEEHNGDENPLEHQQRPPAEGQGTESTSCKKVTRSNAEFAIRLYKHIASDPAAQNVLFSPLSISTAFAMLTLGAKADTQHQIFHGLGFNLSCTEEKEVHRAFNLIVHTLNQPTDVTQMNIGNALFIEESLPLRPEFLNDIKTLYEAEGFPTNFKNSAAAENEINNYIKNKTEGKITQAIQGLFESIAMFLLNYSFFKASRENPFYDEPNVETDFFVDPNTTVKVNMMHRGDCYDNLFDDNLFCWVVRVPYNGNYFAWFIVPDEGKLKNVEDALSVELLDKWRMSLKPDEIRLYIPKFSISGSYDVKDILQKHGVIDVFNENADLSGITAQRNLSVSRAVHKAVLDFHEGGTEAAAVTTLEMIFLPARFPPPVTIIFNRPFIIMITNKQVQHIIFMGKVMDPTAK